MGAEASAAQGDRDASGFDSAGQFLAGVRGSEKITRVLAYCSTPTLDDGIDEMVKVYKKTTGLT
jgi:hypothetical protein